MRVWSTSRLVIGAVLVVFVVTIIVAGLGGLNSGPSRTPAAGATSTPSAAAPGSPAAAGASPTGTAPSAQPSATPATPLEALLGTLVIAPERRVGYARSLFRLWIDADGDGCNTRKEVLIAEAIAPPSIGPRCALTGGRWLSAYDGLTFTTSTALDIDHVVPLAEAWDSGAYQWSKDRRMRYANDLDVPWALIAVSSSSNRSKGDQDPTDWLPTRTSFRCTYVTMWIEVKARWSLTIDTAEHDTLETLAAACPSSDAVLLPAP